MNTDTATQQNKKNIERCTHHLKTIGKAIQSYHEEHGDYPKWLSDLVPKHLDDVNILICPDNSGASPFECYLEAYGDRPEWLSGAISAIRRNKVVIDVSYSYKLTPACRYRTIRLKGMYGDVVPIVQCWHHGPYGDYHASNVLNLSFGNKVYKSKSALIWDESLEQVYGSPEAAIDALEFGFQRNSNQRSFSDVYPKLLRLYVKTGRKKDAEKLIDRFKKFIELTEDNSYYLEDMLEAMNRDDELLALYDKLEKQHPKSRAVFERIANFHKERGNTELELEYREKYIPGLKYLGKMVPDFSSTDLDGNPISIEAYRGKVVLLDFWATWSEFRETIINKKRVYKAYKDKGFDILGISIDVDVTKLRDYLEKSGIPWRQVCHGKGWQCPVSQQYQIQIYGLPTMWLIDKDGKLISHEATGNALNRLVTEALKEESS